MGDILVTVTEGMPVYGLKLGGGRVRKGPGHRTKHEQHSITVCIPPGVELRMRVMDTAAIQINGLPTPFPLRFVVRSDANSRTGRLRAVQQELVLVGQVQLGLNSSIASVYALAQHLLSPKGPKAPNSKSIDPHRYATCLFLKFGYFR